MLKHFLSKIFSFFCLCKILSRFCNISSTRVTVIKNQEISENGHFQFIQSWKSFCDDFSINGIYIIFGTNHYDKVARIATFLYFTIISSGCIYLCYTFIAIYLSYPPPLQTSMVYSPVDELEFPAITFCHSTFYKRSFLGPIIVDLDPSVLNVIASVVVEGNNQEKLFVSEARKNCKINRTTDQIGNHNVPITINDLFVQFKDASHFLAEATIDPKLSTVKCWWNSKVTKCENEFENSFIDYNPCFVFNQNSSVVAAGNFLFNGTPTVKAVKSTDKTSKYSGLKVVLNAQQNESCSTIVDRRGAGFRIFLHKPQSQPNSFTKDAVRLQPGYMYMVAMRPVKIVLETEFLGYCTSGFHSIIKDNDDDEYNQELCAMECMLEFIWKRCKCLLIGVTATDKLVRYLRRKSKEDVPWCRSKIEAVSCQTKSLLEFARTVKQQDCPKCKRKCVDTTYEATITAMKISPQFLRDMYSDFRADGEYMRKTLIVAEFQFEEMLELKITESLQFTGRDLFVYIGGTAGLFWGASTLTLYEIVHQIVYTVTFYLMNSLKRLRKTKKKQKGHWGKVAVPANQAGRRKNEKVNKVKKKGFNNNLSTHAGKSRIKQTNKGEDRIKISNVFARRAVHPDSSKQMSENTKKDVCLENEGSHEKNIEDNKSAKMQMRQESKRGSKRQS